MLLMGKIHPKSSYSYLINSLFLYRRTFHWRRQPKLPSNSTPCILCRGEQLFLSVDKIPLFVVASHNVALLLTAAHYVFNIAYPTGLEQVFSFFEFVFWVNTLRNKGIHFQECLLN